MQDDVIDEKRHFIKKILLKIFNNNRNYRKIFCSYGNQIELLGEQMDKVNLLERNSASFDVLTNAFGVFLLAFLKFI